MRKLTYYTVLSLFILSLGSCDDNLTIEPEQDLSPDVATSSPSNIRNIVNNIYGEARDNDSYGGGIAMAADLLGDDGKVSWNGTYTQPAEYEEKAIISDNFYVELIWLNAYEINNQANIVLANLDIFEDADQRDLTEGEAKFLRALAYFDLVRLFAKPYEAGQTNSQLAVPIVLEPVLDAGGVTKPPRNTAEEVYSQVLNDLSDAYSLLPEKNGAYADKFTARALQARVYLQMGDYENARDAANDVIQNSRFVLTADYASAFNNDGNSAEDIFAWQVTSQDASINSFNEFWAGEDFGGRTGNPDISINDEHFDIYDDPNDERGTFFYETDRYIATNKWKSQYANIPFIRLAEMYLIRAESNFRLNTEVGATPTADINVLRNRANASEYNTVDLDIILKERQRELSFEGIALFDAKRLKRNVGDIPYDANRLVLPVPLREMDANPNLVQNPGY